MTLDASPFYAVVKAAQLACPLCQKLIVFGSPTSLHHKAYDPAASVLKCPGCHRSFIVGLILWPAPMGPRPGLPVDQRPSLRQLAELRSFAKGFYARQVAERDDRVNRFIEGECCCYPKVWDAECPVHGGLRTSGEEWKKPKAEEPEGEGEA